MNQALNFVIVNKITKLKSNNKHLYFDKLITSHNFVFKNVEYSHKADERNDYISP